MLWYVCLTTAFVVVCVPCLKPWRCILSLILPCLLEMLTKFTHTHTHTHARQTKTIGQHTRGAKAASTRGIPQASLTPPQGISSFFQYVHVFVCMCARACMYVCMYVSIHEYVQKPARRRHDAYLSLACARTRGHSYTCICVFVCLCVCAAGPAYSSSIARAVWTSVLTPTARAVTRVVTR